MPALKPKVRSDLSVVEMEGEAIIYDEQTTQIHYLNRTATIVFNLCDGRSTIREFSEEIAEAFSLPREEIERQVRSLIRNFREAGFLDQPASRSSVAPGDGSVAPDATLNGTRTSRKRPKRS